MLRLSSFRLLTLTAVSVSVAAAAQLALPAFARVSGHEPRRASVSALPDTGAGCAAAPDSTETGLWSGGFPGWTGADGALSAPVGPGRTLWAFGDTFQGTIRSDGTRSQSTPMVHNSLVLQTGHRLHTLNYMRGLPPEPAFQPLQRRSYYWPGAMIRTGRKLQLLLMRFHNQGPGVWSFRYQSMALATIALPSLTVKTVTPLKGLGDVEWGSWLQQVGPYIYIYGVNDTQLVKYVHVARVRGDLTGRWQYWGQGTWTGDPARSVSVLDTTSNMFSVLAVNGHWVLISQNPVFSPTISAYAASSPVGPFAAPVPIYTTPSFGTGTFTYNAVAHPEQGLRAGLEISYDANFFTGGGDYSSASVYRPRFIRVPVSCLP